MNRTTRWAAVAAASVLLTGCGSTAADNESKPAPDKSSTGSHTMPDGSVMSDDEMQSGGAEPAGAEPSPAARMVCDGDVADDVQRISGLGKAPTRQASWSEPMYTCTYSLPEGPLVLSVHDATDAQSGRDHYETLRTTLDDAQDIVGMTSLGLPAYETGDGVAVFIKDDKTLEVDATALPDGLGPDGDMTQADLAYAVATSVLACWEKHT
ncbi:MULTISPECIES: hypothetical protein [unclassified Nocardioides]|uniref:hypothetical protein n=1 Tax=unclassified Nocardioides TaxID=2615069 RepID=UPI0006FE14C4|nr:MULTISPECIES: hypothetical protein [unclassified Nocardioides]KQY56644.1 hypothetical protein ASD30_09995 [Nocardioides sp. Root140]KQZ75403.1 hypothetical protein ASD66_03310 [Nocardioides sp. Root151]KRF14477.1 hypothetical protein ASH02_09100 [Nocardioides sp. Soil796]